MRFAIVFNYVVSVTLLLEPINSKKIMHKTHKIVQITVAFTHFYTYGMQVKLRLFIPVVYKQKTRVLTQNSGLSKKTNFSSKTPVLTQNSVFFRNFRTFRNSPFKRRSFNTKFRVFQKIPYIQKFPAQKTEF